MPKETRVHARVPERQRLSIHPDRAILQRTDEFFGGVHQHVDITVVFPAEQVGNRYERFDRSVSSASAHTCERCVHSVAPFFDCGDGVRDSECQVVVRMDADLRFWLQHGTVRLHSVADVIHEESTAGVRDVDAMRTSLLHDESLLGQSFWIVHVAHHQEAGDVHTEIACLADVLDRDVGLGAMGCDAD